MSTDVVRIEGFGDYLDYIYGGEDNVENLSDDEVKSILNVTTALMLLSNQLMILCKSAMTCMSIIGYQASAEGQSELAAYVDKNIREFESMCSTPLSDPKVYDYHNAATRVILQRMNRMPKGVYFNCVLSHDEKNEGGEVACYVEPCRRGKTKSKSKGSK